MLKIVKWCRIKRVKIISERVPIKNYPKFRKFQNDYSRELFAAILPDKTQYSSKEFLDQVIDECAYSIECYYTDNGTEYKGDSVKHSFMKNCEGNNISQRFTKVRTPQTNGKAEKVIRTIMEMWHNKVKFTSSTHRKNELKRFINYYNLVKPRKEIDDLTPIEKLIEYFYPKSITTRENLTD